MSNTTVPSDPTTTPQPTTPATTPPLTTTSSQPLPTTSIVSEPDTTSTVSLPPTSTTTVAPSPTTPQTTPSPTVETTTSIVETNTGPNGEASTATVFFTSTFTPSDEPTSANTPTSATSNSSTPSALSADSNSGGSGGGGLGTGGTIAIAVVIPLVAIALLLILGFWLWRKRKAKKNAEEMRKSEMAEYGFNPNNDPSLVPAATSYAEDQSDVMEDNSGYRGWGATNSNRNAPTTLGSRGPGMSDSGSQPGGYYPQSSPNGYSDGYSADPLMHGHPEGGDGVGALGGAAAGAAGGATAAGLARNRSQGGGGVHRGPSNASSAYSNAAHSEASSEAPSLPRPYYQEDAPYNGYSEHQNGPYGDGTYAGDQPVVRDVQARRNTRIERAPTFPQQQGGISQNF